MPLSAWDYGALTPLLKWKVILLKPPTPPACQITEWLLQKLSWKPIRISLVGFDYNNYIVVNIEIGIREGLWDNCAMIVINPFHYHLV